VVEYSREITDEYLQNEELSKIHEQEKGVKLEQKLLNGNYLS